jgi:hypothetical protein
MTEPTEEDDRRGVGDDDGQAVRHGTMGGNESAGTKADLLSSGRNMAAKQGENSSQGRRA